MSYYYDVHSEAGSKAQLIGENKLHELSKKIQRGFFFIKDEKDKDITPLSFDGFICKSHMVVAMFEVRTRKGHVYNDGIVFRGRKYPTYMITKRKLDKCSEYSKYLNLPFVLFVYFEYNHSFLIYKISDKRGNFLIDFETQKTKSQYSVNGGVAYRENAFIDVSKGTIIRIYD